MLVPLIVEAFLAAPPMLPGPEPGRPTPVPLMLAPGPKPGLPIPVPLIPALLSTTAPMEDLAVLAPESCCRWTASPDGRAGMAPINTLDVVAFGEPPLAEPLFVGLTFTIARGAPRETAGPKILSACWAKLAFAASAMITNTAHSVRRDFQCSKSNMSVRTLRFTVGLWPELPVMSRRDPLPRDAPGQNHPPSLETSSAAPARPRAT
jgi:hypothetical protein